LLHQYKLSTTICKVQNLKHDWAWMTREKWMTFYREHEESVYTDKSKHVPMCF
jgi:hypothetical protein